MPRHDSHEQHLQNLRTWRNRESQDLSLSFIKKQFTHDVERPHKQVGSLIAAWEKLVPPEVASRTSLVALRRGVLTVEVPDSSVLYELTGLLRDGLQQQLRDHSRGSLVKVKVQLAGKRD